MDKPVAVMKERRKLNKETGDLVGTGDFYYWAKCPESHYDVPTPRIELQGVVAAGLWFTCSLDGDFIAEQPE